MSSRVTRRPTVLILGRDAAHPSPCTACAMSLVGMCCCRWNAAGRDVRRGKAATVQGGAHTRHATDTVNVNVNGENRTKRERC
eukprot:7379630-Prymnesium_polylepis.2